MLSDAVTLLSVSTLIITDTVAFECVSFKVPICSVLLSLLSSAKMLSSRRRLKRSFSSSSSRGDSLSLFVSVIDAVTADRQVGMRTENFIVSSIAATRQEIRYIMR